jgi:hypothetical protein
MCKVEPVSNHGKNKPKKKKMFDVTGKTGEEHSPTST